MRKNNNKYLLKGVCPKCFEEKILIRHSLFPVKFFEKNEYFLYLCEECSEQLNNILIRHGKIHETIYFKIQKGFIRLGETDLPICLDKGQEGTKLKAVCPRCFEPRFLEKHHIYPRRFFESTERLFLCSSHHKKVEKWIPKFHKLHRGIYIRIHKAFIRGLEIPKEVQKILRQENLQMQKTFKKLVN